MSYSRIKKILGALMFWNGVNNADNNTELTLRVCATANATLQQDIARMHRA